MSDKSSEKKKDKRTVVYLVRHGDRQTGTGIKGHPGAGLSKLGIRQAKKAAKEFGKIKDEIDKLYSSTMTRAIETAKEISKVIGKKINKIHELSEFSWRLFVPKKYKNKVIPKFLKTKYWKHYFQHKKSIRAFNKILKENKGKTIVIVVHGNIIRGLIGAKLKIPLKRMIAIKTDNCSIAKVKFNGTRISRIYYLNALKLR